MNEQSIRTQEQRIKQEEANLNSAQYDLNKVRVVSPIDGLVTRRNIEEGETAVVGTMNNAGTVLLDDRGSLGHRDRDRGRRDRHSVTSRSASRRRVTIDAIPDKTFPGKVTEVGNSPIQTPGAATAQRATNFKVVVTIDGQVPDVRPGFTCTAVITTATRQKAIARADSGDDGSRDDRRRGGQHRPAADARSQASARRATPGACRSSKTGQTRKEIEGVFIVQDGRAVFVPVKTGIAGEKYFEVLDGLKEGDEVITGPFQSVRGMKDGDQVKVDGWPTDDIVAAGFSRRRSRLKPAPTRRTMQQFLEAVGHRAAGDLGEQAAIVADRARQHRRGHVDHRRGVARPGSEREREETRSSRTSASTPSRSSGGRITVTEEEEERAAEQPARHAGRRGSDSAFSPHIRLVMAEAGAERAGQVPGPERSTACRIRGVTKEFIQLPTTNIERGPGDHADRVRRGRDVAILGWDTADRLFGAIDPIDKTITLDGVHFRVVGVAEKKGAIFGQSQDEFAIIPLRRVPAHLRHRDSRSSSTVLPTDPSARPGGDGRRDGGDAHSAAAAAERAGQLRRALVGHVPQPLQPGHGGHFRRCCIGVVSLSLVVGGIVIMNIMLMVVSERTREIGLRKSLGARRRDILWQILTESITLSTFGGMIGTGLGFLVAWGISKVSPLPAIVEPWSVVLGISMTAIVGLFFGLYPAMRAARLDPIEALRRE